MRFKAYAAGIDLEHAGAVDQRSDAHSPMGSARPANSAMGNSDADEDGIEDSDNSYAELRKLH